MVFLLIVFLALGFLISIIRVRFAGPNSLQPFIRVGRSNYTYEITDSLDSENSDILESSGQIIGGGVEFYLNNAMSIVAGHTLLYNTFR